jgi:ABC transport system ATP-binding/permease protein
MTLLLWYIAGVESEILNLPKFKGDKYFYATLGMIMLIVGIISSLSFTYAIYSVVKNFFVAIPLGLFWGFFIIVIDRAMILTTVKTKSISIKQLIPVLMRIFISIILGIIISTPVELFILNKEIKVEIDKNNIIEEQKIQNEISSLADSKEIVRLSKENENLRDTNTNLDRNLLEANQSMIGERDGKSGTGKPGPGGSYNDKKVEFERQEKIRNKTVIINNEQIVKNNGEIEKLKIVVNAKTKNISDSQLQADSILAQITTLHKMGKADPTVAWTHWLISLLFIIVDTLPITIKTLYRTAYESKKNYQRIKIIKKYDMLIENLDEKIDGKTRLNNSKEFDNSSFSDASQEPRVGAENFYKENLDFRQELSGDLHNEDPINSINSVINLSQLFESQEIITLGRHVGATLRLDSPIVDSIHATIKKDSFGRYILQDCSTNGVFVNGQRVNKTHTIHNGATIRINPFTITLEIDELKVSNSGDQIRLEVNRLILEKKGKRILDNLSFSIEPGQFVSIVGGSGAGKSTLMQTLLGIENPTSGAVYINGNNLRQNFDIYRNQIGYVPQDDIIHMDLNVEEVLTYAAKLRLPPDINLRETINKVLMDIKMTERRKALIKNLSGGQRKRVSVGVELLANPKLFFLDEPTSGLDPGLDKEMMRLLKKLAHQEGRTIILVTHATNNIVDCDLVVFLGDGGKLCYFGTPEEALNFFQVTDFANIYIKLKQKIDVDKYAKLYQNSLYFQKYISNNHKINYNNKEVQATPIAKKASSINQWKTLTERYFKLVVRDRANLIQALIIPPVCIILMSFVVDRHPFILGSKDEPGLPVLALQVLFIFTCASLWVGLSSSLQEVVKESAIYSRERLVNLRLRSYLGSKVTVLGTLAVIQTILIVIFITIGFKPPTFNLVPWQIGIFINTSLTLTASFSLGLLASTVVKNSTGATSALTLLALPQIIFSGVLFKLQGVTAAISCLMLSRWAIGAYGIIVNINDLLPKSMKTSLIKDMPFPTGIVYEPTWSNLSFNWLMLLAHIIFYLTVTVWLQKKKDIL